MKILAVFLVIASYASAQTRLDIRPEVIAQCAAGNVGRAQISWITDQAGPVQVRVGGADGAPMTGLEPPQGSAETDYWVRDGMVFVLVDAAGRELARATARVECATAQPQGSYFPLAVGNEWVFRSNSRIATSVYVVRKVTRKEIARGREWFVVDNAGTETLMRNDEAGRVYQISADGREQLWLDPTEPPDPGAALKITRRGPYSFALGGFGDSVTYQTGGGLLLERGTLVRGLGLAASRTDMLTGSSGGFFSGLELVQARVDGAVRSAGPSVSLGVAVESADLDVSGKKVTNCAVPCYFVACALAPGADPPGTYKPCFQVRVDAAGLSGELELDFLDPAGNALLHVDRAAPGFRQIPLYGKPNEPYAPGTYRVRARSGGSEAAVAVRVR